MIYVYALTDPAAARAFTAGTFVDEPLETLSRGEVAAIYSSSRADQLSPSKENLLRHEQVAEALMARADLLPTRFGTRFSSIAKLADVMERNAAPLREGLIRVRHCVELGLRILTQDGSRRETVRSAGTAEQSGREYMLARLEQDREARRQEQEAHRLASTVEAYLKPVVKQGTWQVARASSHLITAAYLVPRNGINSFRGRVQAFSDQHPELRLLCTGPWPPYNFTPQLDVTEQRYA